ncbi:MULTISPECIES: nucleotidyltransferase domain-containing protein [Psychrilyobacter]|uniref:Nucleotidyltransferase n=1 Tax=Psychrilyobacter piezotolerans TaxID=2293438 RepID=A0ABX9KGZ7_9FUSO|nr:MULTISPECIES: nucleotidyltransferase [Psychrilyobacter]MCS5421998.1 nucleotidyltransferase [Psychrilyobacter sp. S5]NDI77732.1 nucleotidyltransferase [Psychrilyobacter piezotolerans]RDE61430.1 nucleotidyltransferase [Psychrilyobacter sp. S5]REI40951.1 nucleotidyltransferase [Psychrilyobacter piezotolerans]
MIQNKIKRRKDFNKLITGLDITPTMYKNAIEKYKALAEFFKQNGIDCDIYPQGSFALGTVVKPYKEGKDTAYDLDFICLIKKNKNSTDPKEIKNLIGDLLKGHKIYSDMLIEWDKCWTLNYADINGVGFNIDIIPAAEDEELIFSYDVTKQSIAITNKNSGTIYTWIRSNPKGYIEWFNYINKPFLDWNRDNQRQAFMESYKGVYNTVEEIPDLLLKTPLQKVIQIFKRHRDIYFHKIKKSNKKTISAIITTICAEIAKTAPFNLEVNDLLEFIVKEFKIYSERQILDESSFDQRYKERIVIKKSGGNWSIINPVNPEDNLADQWNSDPEKAKLFFQWVENIQTELIDSFGLEDEKFISILEGAIGKTHLSSIIDTVDYNLEPAREITRLSQSWRQ